MVMKEKYKIKVGKEFFKQLDGRELFMNSYKDMVDKWILYFNDELYIKSRKIEK